MFVMVFVVETIRIFCDGSIVSSTGIRRTETGQNKFWYDQKCYLYTEC